MMRLGRRASLLLGLYLLTSCSLRPTPRTRNASPPAGLTRRRVPVEVWINPPKTRATEEALLH